MTLADYLRANSITDAEFARLVGSSRQNVNRWKLGQAVPRAPEMIRISNATARKVTANDFYRPIPKPQPEGAAA